MEKNYAICKIELIHIDRKISRFLKDTLAYFRDVCHYLSEIVVKEWTNIQIEETNWKQMCQDVYTEWKKAVFFEGALCIGLLIIVAIISVHY